jgi:hypothetical protein
MRAVKRARSVTAAQVADLRVAEDVAEGAAFPRGVRGSKKETHVAVANGCSHCAIA